MSVVAIKPGYHGDMKDTVDKFHGNQLLGIGWDKHLMYATPACIPVPPDMPFGALVEKVLPTLFGQHPQFSQISWDKVEWILAGKVFTPAMDKSIKDNGIEHKQVIRFRTPGLDGLFGASF